MPRVHILCLLHHFDSEAQLHWAAAELFIAEQRNVVTNPSWPETLFPRLEPSLGDRMGSGGKLDVGGL